MNRRARPELRNGHGHGHTRSILQVLGKHDCAPNPVIQYDPNSGLESSSQTFQLLIIKIREFDLRAMNPETKNETLEMNNNGFDL